MNKSSLCYRLPIVGLALICISMTGCLHMATSLGLVPQKPKITLADLKVKSASLTNIDVDVVLNVFNQDSKELQVDRLYFDLLLGDEQFGSGSLTERLTVTPNAEKRVQIPVSLQTKELLGVAVDIMTGKARDKARIRGSASIATWAGALPVPFDRAIEK